MPEPKKPQDRLPKQTKSEPDEYFSFTTQGNEYTMPKKTREVVTPGYNRRRRHLDAEDRLWGMLEDLADGDKAILDSFDTMTDAEWETLQRDLAKHLGLELGE
jgi:hypothetical protein